MTRLGAVSFHAGTDSAKPNASRFAKRNLGYLRALDLCEEETMKIASLMIAGVALACSWTVSASAQQAVRPQWNYQGSAVCPDGYDYRGGLCRARGYGGGYARYGGGWTGLATSGFGPDM